MIVNYNKYHDKKGWVFSQVDLISIGVSIGAAK